MNFVVIDVETANPSLSSICQIGIAPFRDGVLTNPQQWLVNPEDYFDPINVSIHGIDESTVRNAPKWPEVYAAVAPLLAGGIVASHTAFDRSALTQACGTWKLSSCECRWLDTARVVRRAWPQFSKSGYGLANVAATFGIKYQAHDASEDARCAGEILMIAIGETGLPRLESARRLMPSACWNRREKRQHIFTRSPRRNCACGRDTWLPCASVR